MKKKSPYWQRKCFTWKNKFAFCGGGGRMKRNKSKQTMKIFLILASLLSGIMTFYSFFIYAFSAVGSGNPLRVLCYPLWINTVLSIIIIGGSLFYFFGDSLQITPFATSAIVFGLLCIQIASIIITFKVLLK